MKEPRPEVTHHVTAGQLRRGPDQPIVAVRLHLRDQAPLVVSLIGARSTLIIGRGEQSDLRIHDDSVSRVHGLLRHDDDHWVYVDVGSANGSFLVAGDDATQLKSGDQVVLSPGERIRLSKNNLLEPLTALPLSDVNASTRSAAGLRFESTLTSVAPSSLPVFLLGPSGAGKTWAARVLHDRSGRKGAFIALNCARLASDAAQLHSELLGHKKGSFTGAVGDRQGAFFAAAGGTLFLDEVESLSSTGQGFLLDLLEEAAPLLPLGVAHGARAERHNVRVISASKVALSRSSLRADLTHRLTTGEIVTVPRLAQRREDIPGFVEQFIARAAGDRPAPTVTQEAMFALRDATWRGEVRELLASVEILVDRALRSGRPLIDRAAVRERLDALAAGHGHDDAEEKEEQTSPHLRALLTAEAPLSANPYQATADQVRDALVATDGNIDQAARRLGWARNTLTAKMKRFGIARPGAKNSNDPGGEP